MQMAEPMSMVKMAAWTVTWRPKISEIWAQKNRKAAEVRLKEEMIQLSCLNWSSFELVLLQMLAVVKGRGSY